MYVMLVCVLVAALFTVSAALRGLSHLGRGRQLSGSSRGDVTTLGMFKGLGGIFGGEERPTNSMKGIDLSKLERTSTSTLIIGAGLSGLACAIDLQKKGKPSLVLEATDRAGGRIKTDVHPEGYLLDRGFQVFIEEYPDAKTIFGGDYSDLKLKQFLPGAKVRYDGELHLVSDPFRRPQDILPSLVSPIGTLTDKIKVGLFSVLVRFLTIEELFSKEEVDTYEFLTSGRGDGLFLTPLMVERFFNPFYQGIFLSPLSLQSSRMFQFVFKMFTEGAASLPEKGMGQVGEVLAKRLPSSSVRYGHRVEAVKRNKKGKVEVVVAKEGGGGNKYEVFECESLVLAADPVSTKKLLEGSDGVVKRSVREGCAIPDARKSICLYFGFDGPPPVTDPMLILNGESRLSPSMSAKGGCGPVVNNICFPSQVSSAYAPEGKSLISVTVVPQPKDDENSFTDEELESATRKQLGTWFKDNTDVDVSKWDLLRIYRIPYAQPAQTPPYAPTANDPEVTLADDVFVCGDHRGTATLNGAINSGRRVAELL